MASIVITIRDKLNIRPSVLGYTLVAFSSYITNANVLAIFICIDYYGKPKIFFDL